MTSPVYVVLGAGPGLGLGVARRFASGGYAVALLGRTAEEADRLAGTLREEVHDAEGAAVDLLDPDDVAAAVGGVGERRGRIDVLHFNPSAWREKSPLELTVPELLEDVAFGAGALLPALQAARPHMADGARVLVTGSVAAERPWFRAATLGVQKAAVRNLVTSIDNALKGEGIRAVALQVNGSLATEGRFSPPPIADAMWEAVHRPVEDWTSHVSYDKE